MFCNVQEEMAEIMMLSLFLKSLRWIWSEPGRCTRKSCFVLAAQIFPISGKCCLACPNFLTFFFSQGADHLGRLCVQLQVLSVRDIILESAVWRNSAEYFAQDTTMAIHNSCQRIFDCILWEILTVMEQLVRILKLRGMC